MRKIEIQVYYFNELSEKAKQKARDKWRSIAEYSTNLEDNDYIDELLAVNQYEFFQDGSFF